LGPLRRADSGVEVAFGIMAVLFVSIGAGTAVDSWLREWETFLLCATVLGAIAAGRWGFSSLAAGAALAGFVLLARFPQGRALWIVASALLFAPALYGGDAARLAPSHRLSCRVLAVASLLALYAAVHLGSWDGRWIEDLADFHEPVQGPGPGLRAFSILATALLPFAVAGLGIAQRRPLLLNVGVLLGVASATTLRFYVHVAPVWVVLIGAGAAALGLALLVRRILASSPGGERGGFTAAPLFDDPARRRLTEVAAVLVSHTPPARAPETAPSGGLSEGGGRFGGGGATGDY
jgi:hypothetical protein